MLVILPVSPTQSFNYSDRETALSLSALSLSVAYLRQRRVDIHSITLVRPRSLGHIFTCWFLVNWLFGCVITDPRAVTLASFVMLAICGNARYWTTRGRLQSITSLGCHTARAGLSQAL